MKKFAAFAIVATIISVPFLIAWNNKISRELDTAFDGAYKRLEDGMAESDRAMQEVLRKAYETHL